MIPRTHLIIIFLTLLIGSALGLLFYPHLPPTVPIHWNLQGQPNGFGPRWVDSLLFPAISWLLMLFLLLLPFLKSTNISPFSRTYGRILVTLSLFLLIFHTLLLLKAANYPLRIEHLLPALIGLLLAILGNWMGKIRRNRFVGIRTPWTLSSDFVWERTHRLGGRLFALLGITIFLTSLLAPPPIIATTSIAGLLLITLWAMLYSYRLSRHTHTFTSQEQS